MAAELITPEADPIAQLDELAARSLSEAREGLSMAINDTVEMTHGWSQERVAATDTFLQRAGLPTLTGVRRRFSATVRRAVRRGNIKDDVEYYAIRNAVESAGSERERLEQLLARYEEQAKR